MNSILIALIGATGVIIGSLVTILGQILKFHLELRIKKEQMKPRKELLKKMLEKDKDGWRKLETLQHVIGADSETTKMLLIEIGARASESGSNSWALIKYKPLPEKE